MNEHFIENIEIQKFKCFENFKAEGFARVNLITGENNVGKTTFMEACFLSECIEPPPLIDIFNEPPYVFIGKRTIYKLVILDMYRDIHNFYYKWLSRKYNFREIKTKEMTINGASFDLNSPYDGFPNKVHDFNSIATDPDFPYFKNSNFMPINLIFDEHIRFLIGDIKLNRKIRGLNNILFDVFNVQSIDDINNQIMLETDTGYQTLSNFGDGIKHFLNIIIALFSNENKVVYLDEIDSGIHYSVFDKLWEVVLTMSKKQNTQVFATTHSKECIESYARVAKKLEDEEVGLIELGKKDDEIQSIVLDYNEMISEVDNNMEVRGW